MGKMGTGKTLSMTTIGRALSSSTKAPLYANYTLKNCDYKKIEAVDDLWSANHGIVLFDEIWLTIDSRNWKNNIKLSHWLNQTRKKDLIILYTTQHIRQVDIRLRKATDWLIYCEKKTEGIWLNFLDYQYGTIGKRFLIPEPYRFYSLYDTYEVLKTLKSNSQPEYKSNYR